MSTPVLLLGRSGTGKTASLRNLDPAATLLIQAIRKPLSFKKDGWGPISKANPKGNIIVTDSSEHIIAAMTKTRRKIIVIDDFQATMANEFMRRSSENGFQKFSDIGKNAWNIFTAAANLPEDVRVYILCHSTTDDYGLTKMHTIGKLLDEKIVPEGFFTIVLKTVVEGGDYKFATHNSGSDSVKSPIGMFDDDAIENDLAYVDNVIMDYYGIEVVEPA